jgi:hypothetical protein
MQSHQLNSQPPKPEIQAILDIAEIQGVPVWYQDGLFMVKMIELVGAPNIFRRKGSSTLGTQNLDTILRWIEEYKKWNPQ